MNPWALGLLVLLATLAPPQAHALVRVGEVAASAFRSKRRNLEGVGTTTSTTTALPPDVPTLENRIAKLENLTKALDGNATTMNASVSTLLTGEIAALANVGAAATSMVNLTADTAANVKVANGLSTQSLHLESQQRKGRRLIRALNKTAIAVDVNQKMLLSGSSKLPVDVLNTEKAVNATLPGWDTMSGRLNQTEKEIQTLNDTLAKGVGKNVSAELKAMLGGVKTMVQNLTGELKRRRVNDEK